MDKKVGSHVAGNLAANFPRRVVQVSANFGKAFRRDAGGRRLRLADAFIDLGENFARHDWRSSLHISSADCHFSLIDFHGASFQNQAQTNPKSPFPPGLSFGIIVKIGRQVRGSAERGSAERGIAYSLSGALRSRAPALRALALGAAALRAPGSFKNVPYFSLPS